MNISTSIVKVTPELATEYLQANRNNRSVRKSVVNKYANAMQADDWQLTHQGIAFTPDGELVDGQHRLMAIVKSGKTVEMAVSRGVPKAAFAYLDGGATRNVSDRLQIGRAESEVVNRLTRLLKSNHADILQKDLEAVYTAVGTVIETFHATQTRTAAKWFTAAPVRLAAITQMLRYPERAHYIRNLYDNLVAARTQSLPPIGHTIMSQVIRGHASGADTDVFVKALRVFDPKNENLTMIKLINPAEIAAQARAFYFGAYPSLEAALKG